MAATSDHSQTEATSTTGTHNVVKKKIDVTVSGLNYTIHAHSWRDIFFPTSDPRHGRIKLLKDVDLYVKPGKLNVIIGPSGCGKTTLLNIVAGRALGKIEGRVCFNGLQVKPKSLRGTVCYLPASDRLLPFLTVNETLMFNAILKLPNITTAERQEVVDRTMELLALTHARDTQIGGSLAKGLSSGEIRRCSIAQEMIGDPAVLLLDEPTSGLDAVLAYELVALLKRLATDGKRAVLCTLHQPRSAAFQLFDYLTVMSKGTIMYSGKATDAREYFLRTLQRDVSSVGATADDLIDIASDVAECLEPADTPITGSATPGEKTEAINVWAEGTSDRAIENWKASEERKKILEKNALIQSRPEIRGVQAMRREKRNFFLQFFLEVAAITFRSFWNQIRNPVTVIVTILIQVISGFLIGAIFFNLPEYYLPAREPPRISDPDSPSMQLVNSKFAKFVAGGMDGQGTNPFVDMIMHGVDGQGSDPINVLVDSNAAPWLANMIPCFYDKLSFNQMGLYKPADFSAYKPLWEGYNVSSPYIGGPWTPPKMIENILQVLQIADYAFYQHDMDWWNSYRFCRGDMACYGCSGVAGEILTTAATCTGLPPPPGTTCFATSDDVFDRADPWDGSEDSPWHSPATSRRLEERVEKIVDYLGHGDRPSRKRKLQASALLSVNLGDLADVLPPRLLKLRRTAEEYADAFRACEHPGCKLVVDVIDGSTTSTQSTLSDYGGVLGAVMNLAGALFFATANIGFASYDGLTAICGERCMFNRETANRTYRVSAYVIGKSLGDLLFQFVPIILQATVFFFMIGLDVGPGGGWYWRYLVIAITIMFAAYGFSYLISACSPTTEVAIVAAPLVLVVYICVAGFFIRDTAVPSGMAWVKYISFYRWGFFGMMLNQFPPDEYYHGLPNSFNLALAGISERSLTFCCVMNIVLGLGYRLLTYVALKTVNKKVGIET